MRYALQPALAHLNLGHNDIGAQGAGRLAEVLGHCASLTHLHLYGNKIRYEIKALCTQCTNIVQFNFSHCVSMHELYISHKSFQPQTWKKN
jgi:hypothetical protein